MSPTSQPQPEPEPHLRGDLFVEFANTGLHSADELAAWLAATGMGPARPGRRRLAGELDSFRQLQRLVRAVADRTDAGSAPSRSQLAALNRVLRLGVHFHELHGPPGSARMSARPIGDRYDQARSAVASSLARFLAEGDIGRLRRCASDSCRWLFVDRSPAGRRRWCDMSVCGNRDKVRRHRQRARMGSSASAG